MRAASAADDLARLFDATGGRKYLCASEWRRFVAAAEHAKADTRCFALVLAYSGCRLSEALALTPAQLDPETDRVIFRSLKRRKLAFRAVPVPAALMRVLAQRAQGKAHDERLWRWCRQTAWRRIKHLMAEAGVRGSQAMPKGLRHGFGIANAEQNIPPALTQRWMGHARLETTAIYQHAVGREEHAFAKRLWRRREIDR